MNARLKERTRATNQIVIDMVWSSGHASFADRLRLCTSCQLTCPGILLCPYGSPISPHPQSFSPAETLDSRPVWQRSLAVRVEV